MDVTIPVDEVPGLREFAAEWFVFETATWVGMPAWHARAGHWAPILPLHIPAGFALGVAWLAKRHGLDPSTEAVAFLFHKGQWLLQAWRPSQHRWKTYATLPGGVVPEHCPTCGGDGQRGSGGPPAKGAKVREHLRCLTCTDGQNPHRTAQALKAWLLATKPST